jgi:hypothetical protein
MKVWNQVQDVRAFLAERGSRRVRDSHEFTRRVLHWPYCNHCGLVALKNDASRIAARAKCVVEE